MFVFLLTLGGEDRQTKFVTYEWRDSRQSNRMKPAHQNQETKVISSLTQQSIYLLIFPLWCSVCRSWALQCSTDRQLDMNIKNICTTNVNGLRLKLPKDITPDCFPLSYIISPVDVYVLWHIHLKLESQCMWHTFDSEKSCSTGQKMSLNEQTQITFEDGNYLVAVAVK